MNADSKRVRPSRNSVRKSADILKYFGEFFWRCNTVGIGFLDIVAGRL